MSRQMRPSATAPGQRGSQGRSCGRGSSSWGCSGYGASLRPQAACTVTAPMLPTRVDVGVVDGRHKLDLGRLERVAARAKAGCSRVSSSAHRAAWGGGSTHVAAQSAAAAVVGSAAHRAGMSTDRRNRPPSYTVSLGPCVQCGGEGMPGGGGGGGGGSALPSLRPPASLIASPVPRVPLSHLDLRLQRREAVAVLGRRPHARRRLGLQHPHFALHPGVGCGACHGSWRVGWLARGRRSQVLVEKRQRARE